MRELPPWLLVMMGGGKIFIRASPWGLTPAEEALHTPKMPPY